MDKYEGSQNKIGEQQATIEETKSRITDLEAMMEEKDGYKTMVRKINEQKQVTRDALSYVAEIKRDRSITPLRSAAEMTSTVSIEQASNDWSKFDVESQQVRDQKLMQILNKSEILK